jgi:hypothetical protein
LASYANSESTYPSQSIDPRLKGYEWIIQYIRAAYRDSRGIMPFGTINTGNLRMAEIKMYGMGRQPVDKYKKMFSPGNPTNESWRAIDWTVPAFMCKFREIALAKLLQKKFDITAFPVDPVAVSEEDEFFNQMKVKIIMREEAEKMGSPMAQSSVLQPNPGEPQDMEQLQIAKDYNYKHEMAIEAENAINLIMQQNGEEEIRKALLTSLYDWGIAAATQCINENGMVKVRPVNMEYFGCSYFEKPDGSDMVHWFEVVPTFVADLAPYYTKEQLDDICQKAAGKNGNPTMYYPVNGLYNTSWSRFKVMVLKCKFLSWNDYVYKEEMDNRGNTRYGKTSYNNKQFVVGKTGQLSEQNYEQPQIDDSFKGQQEPVYSLNCKKVRYKGSWVIETDYMHDWGEDDNQNRKLSSWWDTDLDIQLYAWNFYKMQFTGITERLIPLEDRACMAWFNLQNLSNKLIPYLINLDMNAIEGAFPFGKGGGKGSPSEVVDFIFSNYVVPFRSSELLARNPNYRPVSIEATGQLAAFGQLYDELNHTIDMMRQVSGLNELTDGSTPNAKTLVPVAESAIQSTNNAIFLVSEAEKNILLRTADAIIQKVQIAVGMGKVDGYAKALGDSSVKFFQINPDISMHELGVFITDALSDEQRQMLWNDINIKESQGLLDVGDKAFVMNCRNTQQAYQLLSYKIQKRKEEAHQQQMQLQQQQTEGNAYVAQAAEMAKQQSIQLQLEADLVRINTEMQWQYEIESMKKTADLQGEMVQTEGRNVGHEIQGKAKIIAARISADSAEEKQKIANKKPKTPSKSK